MKKSIDFIVKLIIGFIKVTVVFLLVGIGLNYFNKFYQYSTKEKISSMLILMLSVFAILVLELYNEAYFMDFSLKTTLTLIRTNEKMISIATGVFLGCFIFGFIIIRLAKFAINRNSEILDEDKYILTPLYATAIAFLILIFSSISAYALNFVYIFNIGFSLTMGSIILGLFGMLFDVIIFSKSSED
jgi:hypothetical protein